MTGRLWWECWPAPWCWRLVRVDTDATWQAVAGRYPAWAHATVARDAGADGSDARYACYHDYRSDFGAHLANLPAGTHGVREAITSPEGPLRAGAPRPDSTTNSFCLSCHHDEGQGGLSIRALEYDPDTVAEHDRRRQPSQPPRRVFGNIPAGWIATDGAGGSPAQPLTAPAEGLLIDPWVFPAD